MFSSSFLRYEMIKKGQVKIQMEYEGEKYEVRTRLDENSNLLYRFLKIP